MTNKNDAINHRSGPRNSDQANSGNAEEQVSLALGALRLLIDKDNPLSLRETIARTRELAQTYACWEQSGAPIKDLVVRLSDGQEIAMDQSNIASLCGLHFRNAFPADAVLHIWKKADEHFGEVQLLSLSLRNVRANGYKYENTYRNGQSLALKVERCLDGQFYISVDCTAKERAMRAAPQNYSWLPIIGPVVFAFSKLASFLRDLSRSGSGMEGAGAPLIAGTIMVLVFSLVINGVLLRLDLNKLEDTKNTEAPLGQGDRERLSDILQLKVEKNIARVFHSLLKKSGENNRQNYGAIDKTGSPTIRLSENVTVQSAPTLTQRGVFDKMDEPSHHVNTSEVIDKPDEADASGDMEKPDKADKSRKTIGSNQTESKPDDATAEMRTAIRIKISNFHTAFDEALREAFTDALKRSNQFVVVTENKTVREAECLVDVRFAPKKGRQGVILAELYDDEGNLIWHGDRNCYDLLGGKLFEDAPQQLVREIVSTLGTSLPQDVETE